MNLLLTGAFNYTEDQKKKLSALGFNVFFMQQEAEELSLPAKNIDAIICNGLFLHHDFDKFKNLKFVQLTSAGLDRVPVDKMRERGIVLLNARGVYSIPMAEWAMMRVLEHYKNAPHFTVAQAKGKWDKCRTLREIAGTKVAVIGAGNVGQEVAKRFEALGANTIGFDIHINPTLHFNEMHIVSELPVMVGEYDIIVIAAPLTPETYHLMGREVLKVLKTGATIVNIARGQLIDEQALTDVLAERQDLYAALDVFEQEPLTADSPLWKMKNVAVSPHNSFVSNGNNERMFNVMYNNLKDFANGK
ncbi:NAD(P)-binding domain-containing protein [Parabacteroides faecis]|uniref:NAD(P)-dependent oxidoreductase n=1 Tax=Parabacteroides faecis TaxID=1217282 RepID=UPI002164AFD9|nr:NAD(P)-dependent oxidoreductase [Parabacteroides faecis]MCS2893458.1 NAD(P)-binding domain-containing protein [Parabacteroides faecis]UVQ47937.1 NAD(P)-binding domain-containing protein [Parabacteroides faecis]